jgi:phosphohistidine phosphatase
MKVLTLIRHAKSSWDDSSLPDKDRPLNKRGLKEAPLMGKRLAEQAGQPDLILSSPAVRARTTAELIAEGVGYPLDKIEMSERLYATDAGELLAVIQALDDDLKTVFVCGHNPEMSDLAQRLTAHEVVELPTGAVVELTYKTKKWSAIGEKKPEKIRFDAPRLD